MATQGQILTEAQRICQKGRVTSLAEARAVAANVGSNIYWRPDQSLREENQYAVILAEGERR